jgi:hypothetical protein
MEGAEKAKPPHPHTASSVAGSGRVPDQLLLSSCSTSGWAILFRFLHPDRCAGGQATGMCSFPEHHAGFIRAVYCVCGSRCGRSVERQSVLAVSGSEVSLSSKPVSGAWAIGNWWWFDAFNRKKLCAEAELPIVRESNRMILVTLFSSWQRGLQQQQQFFLNEQQRVHFHWYSRKRYKVIFLEDHNQTTEKKI